MWIQSKTNTNDNSPDTSQTKLEGSKDTNVTRLKVLAKTDFHHGEGNTENKESNQVGHKQRTTTIVDTEGGESPNISKSDRGTTVVKDGRKASESVTMSTRRCYDGSIKRHNNSHSRHVKGNAARPDTAAFLFFDMEGKSGMFLGSGSGSRSCASDVAFLGRF
jgi:hypothetical protein